jgi:hypothetical protein
LPVSDSRLRRRSNRNEPRVFNPDRKDPHWGKRKLKREYFQRFPKDRYETEVESWRQIQSQNIEFTMKRLRDPVGTSD